MAAVAAVSASRALGTPTIRQNPLVAKRTELDEVDRAIAAAERVIARRNARSTKREVR